MSGERAQNEIEIGGVIYDAVIMEHGPYGCDGCAFALAVPGKWPTNACAQAGCMPPERLDGKYAIWEQRLPTMPRGENPWKTTSQVSGFEACAYASTEDRASRVKTMSETELVAALAWPDTQKTVRTQIERRLRKMRREVARG